MALTMPSLASLSSSMNLVIGMALRSALGVNLSKAAIRRTVEPATTQAPHSLLVNSVVLVMELNHYTIRI